VACPVVVRLVYLDSRGLWRIPEVVDIDVAYAIKLDLEAAKHRVVRVASVTRLIGRNAMILEVVCCEMPRIVNMQALAIGLHNVAAEAKSSGLRIL